MKIKLGENVTFTRISILQIYDIISRLSYFQLISFIVCPLLYVPSLSQDLGESCALTQTYLTPH